LAGFYRGRSAEIRKAVLRKSIRTRDKKKERERGTNSSSESFWTLGKERREKKKKAPTGGSQLSVKARVG
jgi:hypothetical protein